MNEFPDPPPCDDRLMWSLFLARYHFPALYAADELGIFEFIETTPATIPEIAAHCGIAPRAAEPIVGLLCSLGVLVQNAGRFGNTETSRTYLLPSSPFYWGPVLRFNIDSDFREVNVLEAAKNKKQFGHEGEGDLWEDSELSAEKAGKFTALMHSFSFGAAISLARRDEFSGVRRLLDVAGGSGCFSIAFAERFTELRCTVLDLPSVCPVTEKYIAQFGLTDRIDTVAGNMFTDAWPAGYDAVFISHIFHDWDRSSCEQLARKAFEALPSGGRIFLHETLLSDTRDGPAGVPDFSVNMLVYTEGKQYTAEELGQILSGAGFGETSVVNTHGFYSLLSARKP
jgi:hypothetical protein